MKQNLRAVACAAALALLACEVSAQAPAGLAAGPVRIGSTLPAGSGPDAVARILAEKLQTAWGRTVIVEPRPGGAGSVAMNALKTVQPTGNDLIVADVGNLVINPLVFKRLSYDPAHDLVPVALLYKAAFFVTVSGNSPYRSAKDLFAAAADPKKRTLYGSNAVGGPIHLGSARLDVALGGQMQHVPYKETSQLYVAVSTGEVDWAYGSLATTAPLVKSGKLRLLAVADTGRSAAAPDVPTIAEAGGPKGLEAPTWVALMAPRGTPPAVVEDMNRAVNEVLQKPDVKERLATFGFVASPGPARQVTELMQSDRTRYAEVLTRVKVDVD